MKQLSVDIIDQLSDVRKSLAVIAAGLPSLFESPKDVEAVAAGLNKTLCAAQDEIKAVEKALVEYMSQRSFEIEDPGAETACAKLFDAILTIIDADKKDLRALRELCLISDCSVCTDDEGGTDER